LHNKELCDADWSLLVVGYGSVEGCGGMVTSLRLLLHIQELYDLYRPPSVVRVVKYKGTCYVGRVVRIDIT
jgi:hypothetical protein